MSTDGTDDGENIQINLTSRDDSEQTSPCESSEHEGTFTLFDAMFFIVGMALYIADFVTDLVVGVQYFRRGDILWSIMTFVFVFVPSIILQYFSFRWYILDMKEETKYESKALKKKLWAWCQWLATHVLQLGAIKRYWRTVKYGLRSRHDYTYYNLMIFEYRDISMLRLQEAFMESAPQLVLQVYIMLESKEFHWLTGTIFKALTY
ncbi:XK-related protein 4-like [Strongylocentrotus purpuratus]|uniref:XK-related protein n=1 Tax=Strongylocentrotus purpuratus TaxID=7668 RepID=A0A7M7GJ97_STRPU|nr:XK-related protein 4-like [Strongylocentrotus purpuratus]